MKNVSQVKTGGTVHEDPFLVHPSYSFSALLEIREKLDNESLGTG